MQISPRNCAGNAARWGRKNGFAGPAVMEAKDFSHRNDCFQRQVYHLPILTLPITAETTPP
jgi:hypothetical protein